MNDYDVYYRAGHSAFEFLMGRPVSFGLIHGESSPFRYPPFMAWVFMPFAWLPLDLGRGVWVAIGWCAYLASLMRLEKAFTLSGYARWALAVGTIRFAVDNSNIGQISTILGWLLIEGALNSNFYKRAGSLALAGLVKLQPLVFVGIWAVRRERALLYAFLASLLALMALSLTFGTEAFVTWLYLSTQATQILDPAIVGNQSLYGTLLRIFGPGRSAGAVFSVTLIITTFVAIRAWRSRGWSDLFAWQLGLASLPVFGLITWKNTYVFWALPLAFLLVKSPRLGVFAAGIFFLPSQGIIGSDWNGALLRYGILPLSALLIILASSLKPALGNGDHSIVKPQS